MTKDDLGLSFTKNGNFYFFGNKNSTLENLEKKFSHFSFARLKQVHEDRVIESRSPSSRDNIIEADAHITSISNLALCIYTADCLPILIGSKNSSWVAGIHAGWRGVAKNILRATIITLVNKGIRKESLEIFVGPHILENSYEVDANVKDLVVQSTSRQNPRHFQAAGNRKFLLNLQHVILSQCLDLGLHETQLSLATENTKLNLDYHSVRREPATPYRQLSFVCKLA